MKLFSPCILPLVTIALLLTACEQATTSAQAQKQTPPPEVTVVTAHSESVPLTREPVGRLAPTRVAEVRARVAGIILRRTYTEGTDVTQGQVLFQIDPAPLQAALHVEEAALARAEADAANAAQIAKRYQDLATKGLISSQDLDTAQSNQRTTAAAVKEAKAKVEKARLDLGYATVTAPIAGHARRALVTEGALVGQGEATQLTTIEQIDPLYVNFSQSVSELQQLQQAAKLSSSEKLPTDVPVEVLLPNGSTYPHAGTLDFSDLSVDASTGAVSLRAVVPNPDRRLLPGMFVRLRMNMGQLDNVFLLPQATVLRDNAGAYVMVVNAEGKVEQRRVETHEMTQTSWIVSGDLHDGDKVILDGLQKVTPGAEANAIPAATSGATTGASSAKP
ncbi:MAG: efflux RND transporter periplasmic adaptor subunit [Gammaproteobacteria bacterium]|nr:efflux RND transporter periplasmic adaptor subunit [Gammaproteobacteria bacterium]